MLAGIHMRLALALFLGSYVVGAAGGVFSVTPVRIHMTPKDRAVAVTVINEGDTAVVLQADLNLWTQKADGADELTLSDDLILSPPIIKLAPKARQVVRLALLVPADAGKQLTYRLILREIPEAVQQKNGAVQVPIALALSMPVFITPPKATRDMSCKPDRDGDKVTVQCTNNGTAYAQIREISVSRHGQIEASFEGGVYVLPGAYKTISLKSANPVPAGMAQLIVGYDDIKRQSFDVTLP